MSPLRYLNIPRSSFLGILALAGALLTFSPAAQAKEVIIGLRALNGTQVGLKQWQATADYLSRRIDGYTFTLAPYESLNDLAAAANHGDFDYVLTNPSSYVEMEMHSGASRLLTLINKRQGKPYTQFGSVIFSRADRMDIRSFDDLRGKTLAAVSQPSFGGWRVAWGELLNHGIMPEKDLEQLSFVGTQHNVVYAVRDGEADAGVVRTDMLERMAGEGRIDLEDFRSIGQRDSVDFPFLRSTELYPEWAFAKLPKAPKGLSREIVHRLLEMLPDDRAAIAGNYVGWSVPLNYQPVHDLLKTLKVGPYKDFGKVTLRSTLLTYRYWIATIAVMVLGLFATIFFALIKNRQLARLRASMLVDRDRELEFQKLALDEHAIVSITDIKGDITYVNDKFCEISGFPREELVGQNHRILKSGEHTEAFYRDLWNTIGGGNTWNGEIKNLKKKGGYYWVQATIVPFLNNQGKPFQYVAIRTDITERKEKERDARKALMLAEKAKMEAEKASNAKSQFLSSMSHELRTPMNAILGFGQMLEFNPDEPLMEEQKDCVNHIMKGGRHLLELIDQVLDLSTIEAGKLNLSLEEVAVNELCLQCLALIDIQAKEHGLSVDRDLGGATFIKADYTRLKQVLLNLLSNAIKYNREGGNIKLVCKDAPGDRVRISVSDTGEGIAKDRQNELFERFNRLGQETGQTEGTGIGLTITKELVEAMGGHIGFESEAAKGSTFWIEFPKTESTLAAATDRVEGMEKDKDHEQSSPGAKVLYIEDNPANLKLMESIIRKMDGLTLITAHNAELGLALAEERHPDLVLMDINLPGMDGIEAMNELGKKDSTQNIPVIAISAAAMKKDIERGVAAGFKAYLTKPFDIPDVIEAIRKELRA